MQLSFSDGENILKEWLFFALWVLLGIGILSWGIAQGVSNYRFSRTAIVLSGTVVEISGRFSDGAWVTSPAVQFSMPCGEVKRYKSRFSSSTSSYSKGDRVDVLWDPASEKVKLDSFGELYFSALFTIGAAVFILFGPVFCLVVLILIWGWPTSANLAKMRAALHGEKTNKQ